MIRLRIDILRREYCSHCRISRKSPRSTGVKLLLSIHRPMRVLDYGCSTWRNSAYLESLGAWSVRVDAVPYTKPDVIAYPTYLPFKNGAFDTVLLTHILMFLEKKEDWAKALQEAIRVSKQYVVLETYRVKHKDAIQYTLEDILKLVEGLRIVRRNLRQDLQNLVIRVDQP